MNKIKEDILEKFNNMAHGSVGLECGDFIDFETAKEFISQSLNTYAREVIKERLPEKMTMRAANSSHSEAGFGWTKGFNDCREQMLINAGIKCKGCGQERCECGKTHNEPYSGFDAVE